MLEMTNWWLMLKEIKDLNKTIYLDSFNIEIGNICLYEYRDLIYIDSFNCDKNYSKEIINNIKNKYKSKAIVIKSPDIIDINKDSEEYDVNLNNLYLFKTNGFYYSNLILTLNNKDIKLLINKNIDNIKLESYLKEIYKCDISLKADNSLRINQSNKHLTGEDIDMLHENNTNVGKVNSSDSLCDTHWDGA